MKERRIYISCTLNINDAVEVLASLAKSDFSYDKKLCVYCVDSEEEKP
jgi:hypothetical protein